MEDFFGAGGEVDFSGEVRLDLGNPDGFLGGDGEAWLVLDFLDGSVF